MEKREKFRVPGVRDEVGNKRTCRGWVIKDLVDYIKEYGLYPEPSIAFKAGEQHICLLERTPKAVYSGNQGDQSGPPTVMEARDEWKEMARLGVLRRQSQQGFDMRDEEEGGGEPVVLMGETRWSS